MIIFNQYTNVTKIIIPENVIMTAANVSGWFKDMTNLVSCNIPFLSSGTVQNMNNTFKNCTNLVGSPVCGNNVVSMSGTYYNCQNLTGSPVCGNNVTSMYNAYSNCRNLHGNSYFYSSNVQSVDYCFCERNVSNMLSIYAPQNSTTLLTLLTNNTSSLVGSEITWTDDTTTNGCYYNTAYNIYIYPVEDVAATCIANGDPDNNGRIHCTGIELVADWGDNNRYELDGTRKQTMTLTATLTPENTTDKVTWASSNTSIATVEDGLVTGVYNLSSDTGMAYATITATCGNYSASYTVCVVDYEMPLTPIG